LITVGLIRCKKLIEIPPPVNTITTSQVFSSDGQAASATANIYYRMANIGFTFSNGGITLLTGMSADELKVFNQTNALLKEFQKNELESLNPNVGNSLWIPMYFIIYNTNAIIEGLSNNSSVHDSVKNELIGEAKFIRSFCYFYLTNLFGNIPLVTTTNYNKTGLLFQSPPPQIYQTIISDLKDAQQLLQSDYSVGGGQRIVPNKWAATALLARVYMFNKDWENAEKQASLVIDSAGLYSLSSDLNGVFLTNSNEAIWQLQQNNSGATSSWNATYEGYQLIPKNATSPPAYYITPQLIHSFDSGDLRKQAWIDSTIYSGQIYYYPYKYKIGRSEATINGPYTEYYMVLRLAEQYLIRAEARTQLNNLPGAANDLNKIRNRAGLSNIAFTTQSDLTSKIEHERQIEFFAEWGHRWTDLKRWGNAVQILSLNKGIQLSQNALFYPIPISEITDDPNLVQNTGY